MPVRFRHTIGNLERDFIQSREGFKRAAPKAVSTTAKSGQTAARSIAKRKAGPHGSRFWKRITTDRIGPLAYEYGPTGTPKTEFVGVGYRTGGGNLDLAQSSDMRGNELGKRLQLVQRGTWSVT